MYSRSSLGSPFTTPTLTPVGYELTVLVVDLRSDRQMQLDRLAVGAVLVASQPGATAAGLELVPRAKVGQVAQPGIGNQHHVAAVAAVAAVGPTLRDVLLAPEGEAAAAAPSRLDVNTRLVVEGRFARAALAASAWAHA